MHDGGIVEEKSCGVVQQYKQGSNEIASLFTDLMSVTNPA